MAYDDSVIRFGKYKNTPWTDIPDSYLQWLVANGEPDKKGTILADTELQARADEGRSVTGDPVTQRAPAANSGGALAALEKRVAALEKKVFGSTGGAVSFDDDSICF